MPGNEPSEKHAKMIALIDLGNKLKIINLQTILLTINEVDDKNANDFIFDKRPVLKILILNFKPSFFICKIVKTKIKII